MEWHIRCNSGDIARYVLLPGDPGRVQRIIAQMDHAERLAENREFIVYTGATGDESVPHVPGTLEDAWHVGEG